MFPKQTDESPKGVVKVRPPSSALPIEHEQRGAKKIIVKTIDISICPVCMKPHNRVMLQVFAVAEGGQAK